MSDGKTYWDFLYPSQRMPVLAENVVATSQPLAAQAGLRMLLDGGNAIDAALAAAIALTVVEPTSNGIGSDAFALVWDGAVLHGLNGSGRSPSAWSRSRFAGMKEMPRYGWDSVTVPGAVDLWATLHARFGALPFERLFEPAISYAEGGFAVSPFTAHRWAETAEPLGGFDEFTRTFLVDGRPPVAGQWFRCPELAATLSAIAETRGETLYRGELARKIADCAAADGGVMTAEDLSEHRTEWVAPISLKYRSVRLHEIPPNGQGLAALVALGVLRHFDMASLPPESAESVHLQVEAMKIGFEVAQRHVADPEIVEGDPLQWLDEDYLARKAQCIQWSRASDARTDRFSDHGTVYLAAADAGGRMVSFIQSNFMGFGSGVVIPNTGIAMQNRGFGFSLAAGHPNEVAGGKRPYHTIIPGFVTRGERPLLSFGVMGGHMQPQGHLQMMVRIFDHGFNPQAASDAPRWQVTEDNALYLEPGFPNDTFEGLKNRGHRILSGQPFWGYGGAQLLHRRDRGYAAASDHRKDGQAVGY